MFPFTRATHFGVAPFATHGHIPNVHPAAGPPTPKRRALPGAEPRARRVQPGGALQGEPGKRASARAFSRAKTRWDPLQLGVSLRNGPA